MEIWQLKCRNSSASWATNLISVLDSHIVNSESISTTAVLLDLAALLAPNIIRHINILS